MKTITLALITSAFLLLSVNGQSDPLADISKLELAEVVYAKEGETLADIAKRYNVPLADIQLANPGLDTKVLKGGEKIFVPKPLIRCSMKIEAAPPVRGVKLAMTRQDIQTLLGRPNVEINDEWSYNPRMRPAPGLEGIMVLNLRFYENRVSEISVSYDSSVIWTSGQEFAKAISDNLKLPYGAWNFQRFLDSRAAMDCGEFTVEADSSVWGRLKLKDLLAEKKKVGDEKAREEAKKKAFKP